MQKSISDKPQRQSISKSLRFEVFKRDSFKCQYCGKCAPEVVLHVDHIHPVSKGGDNDIMNLVTACNDCNSGKSDRLLADDSVMAKQRAQLEELNERREQLEQMLQWRNGLKEIGEIAFSAIDDAWAEIAPGTNINDKGRAQLRKLVDKFGLNAVLDAIETSARYVRKDGEGETDPASAEEAFNKIGGICRIKSQPDWKRDLYYIRGILRNRLSYCNQQQCMVILENAYNAGVDIDALKEIAVSVKSWTAFKNAIVAAMPEEE